MKRTGTRASMLREAVSDGHPRTLSDLREITGIGEASISAYLRQLRREGAEVIVKNAQGSSRGSGIHTYQVINLQ